MERVEALKVVPDTPGALKNHLAKWEALFARLLLTVHLIEIAPIARSISCNLAGACEISRSTARKVERLMLDYLLPNAMRFYAELCGRDEHVQHACWIADHILAHGLSVLKARDMGRAYNALRDRRDLDRAMGYLEMAGWIVPMAKRPGQPVTQWWVDPRVHQVFARRAEQERVRRSQEVRRIKEAAAKLRVLVEEAA